MKNTSKLIVCVSATALLLSVSLANAAKQGIYDIKRLTSEMVTSQDISTSVLARSGSMALAAIAYEDPNGVLPALLDLAELDVYNDYTNTIRLRLETEAAAGSKYPDTLKRALDFILGTINLREERTAYLESILNDYPKSCPELASYAAFNLANLSRETFDDKTADSYLKKAIELDPLSLEAREALLAIHPENNDLDAKAKLLKLKFALNPYDFKTSFLYSMFLRGFGRYEEAVKLFAWTADLFEYMTGQYLSSDIYTPWIETLAAMKGNKLDAYNAIMARISPDEFDMRAESYRIQFDPNYSVDDFEKKINKMWLANDTKINDGKMAWFYTFVKPDVEKAFDYAKKAYIHMPADQSVRDIYAYNLMKRGDFSRVNIFLSAANTHQAARIAMGLSHVDKIDEDMIRMAAESNPLSYEGLEAIRILKENGTPYIAAVLPDKFNAFDTPDGSLVPDKFVAPQDAIAIKITVAGKGYNPVTEALPVNVSIENKLSRPLYIRNGGCFPGRIVVSCSVSGDVTAKDVLVANVVNQSSKPLLPGKVKNIEMDICKGQLFGILKKYPQANLLITPEITILGVIGENQLQPTSRYAGEEISVMRIASLDSNFLSATYKTLTSGSELEKLTAASIFTDLYIESQSNPEYAHKATPVALLVKAVEKGLTTGDDAVEKRILAHLYGQPLPESTISIITHNQITDANPQIRLLSVGAIKDMPGQKKLLTAMSKAEKDPIVKALMLDP